jgi:integrase
VKVSHLHSNHSASRRTHDLRHTFASTALAEGVPISEVSRWLGHKSITTTVDLYGHLVPEASARARDALDKAFRSALDVP